MPFQSYAITRLGPVMDAVGGCKSMYNSMCVW